MVWTEKVVPVATLRNQEETEETLSCLQESGLKVIEITFRTEYASTAIAYAIKNYPQVLVGAGTIINKKQCKKYFSFAFIKIRCILNVFCKTPLLYTQKQYLCK